MRCAYGFLGHRKYFILKKTNNDYNLQVASLLLRNILTCFFPWNCVDTIFVRAYEDRMDLLRAVIMGPAGTPYHDGLFFFDIYFPPQYPNVPPVRFSWLQQLISINYFPCFFCFLRILWWLINSLQKVNYRAGGLRLNPNLYACGKVCLSLLNTWTGNGCEKWNPSNSTMLQVLVSIQALVLNAKPYFNEPGYAMQAKTPHGEKKSLSYNEDTFLLSCRTMLYSLRNPPKVCLCSWPCYWKSTFVSAMILNFCKPM